jgi:hypothetical protein
MRVVSLMDYWRETELEDRRQSEDEGKERWKKEKDTNVFKYSLLTVEYSIYMDGVLSNTSLCCPRLCNICDNVFFFT